MARIFSMQIQFDAVWCLYADSVTGEKFKRIFYEWYRKIEHEKNVAFFLATSLRGLKGAWSNQGCQLSKEQNYENYVTCECNHLTNFALLLDVSQTAINTKALSIVTTIGCGVSLFGLALTVTVHLCFRYERYQ